MNRVDPPGRQATVLDNLILAPLLGKDDEQFVIHHITQNTPGRLQLEIERRRKDGIVFERFIVKT